MSWWYEVWIQRVSTTFENASDVLIGVYMHIVVYMIDTVRNARATSAGQVLSRRYPQRRR